MNSNLIFAFVGIMITLSAIQNAIYPKKKNKAKLGLLVPLSIVWSIAVEITLLKYEELIERFWHYVNLDALAVIGSTIALFISFYFVKAVVAKILIRKAASNAFVEKTVSFAYEYDDVYDMWFLKESWVYYRVMSAAVRWVTAAAVGVLLAMIPSSDYYYTMGAVVLGTVSLFFNELHHFINGQTKDEYEHMITGTDADSRRIGNYYRVREILEKLLPGPLLSAQTGFELAGKRTPKDFLDELEASEDINEQIIAEYFFDEKRYTKAEIDNLKITLNLMKRKNVVYFNPFYRDMNLYLTLPIVHTLISGKKCIIITGRMSSKEDVKDWIENLLRDYSHMPSLWVVDVIKPQKTNCDVGIVSFPEFYDNAVVQENQELLADADLVMLIEPSVVLGTGQVALSTIARQFGNENRKPVYYVCDRMVDGLVDTLSHVLRTEFIEVTAPPVPRCVYTGMTWDANGDFARQKIFRRQTHYLGNGTELAAIAIKNQIPHVSWYGESKAPIRDIKWITGQYYPVICHYMNKPESQNTIYDNIDFVSGLWSAAKQKEQFAIVEDEFDNMFQAMRMYLSRGEDQSFVNVLSENYLLRDYMRCNQQMFLTNPNAVPSMVPDYAKTERNTLIKLLLMMTHRKVSGEEILDEFRLVGKTADNAYEALGEMLERYTDADRTIFNIETSEEKQEGNETAFRNWFYLSGEMFRQYFSGTLATAYYLLEEEDDNSGFVDAKFFSHVTQNVMQGMFVSYDGKYYLVKHVSPQSGVVLRRASDLFDERRYYRQIRRYELPECTEKIISRRRKMDLEIAFVERDIKVRTSGYLEMRDLHDLRTAVVVDLTKDPSIDNYNRDYHRKTVMKLYLPDTDEGVRFTLCLLMNEAFRTLFPDGYQYLAVTTKCSEDIEGMLSKMVWPVTGDVDDEYIYIIEDSDIDLGLLEAVDRNLTKIMEIIGDYLKWHFEKMREPEKEDPLPPEYKYQEEEEEKKKGLFAKLAERIRKLMGSRKEEPIKIDFDDYLKEASADEPEDASESGSGDMPDAASETAASETVFGVDMDDAFYAPEETEAIKEAPEVLDVDETDIFDESGEADDDMLFELEFKAHGLMPVTKTRYQKECFLKFGYDEIDKRIHIEDLMKYLRVHGWTNNDLTLARNADTSMEDMELDASNHCDFCGRPLSGASYELLNDGRIRCNDCSESAITTLDEFKELFGQSLELMESFYGIKFRVPISVKMADARTVAKGAGMIFRPSTEMDARVLGFAQKKYSKYSLVIENGSPRLAASDTLIHEMTHIWQYLNWDMEKIMKIFDMGDEKLSKIAKDIVYEGMAVWSSVQYLYQIGETQYAAQMEKVNENRNDVYGWGFVLYREQYPLVKDSSLIQLTPFEPFPPLEPARVAEFLLEIIEKAERAAAERAEKEAEASGSREEDPQGEEYNEV